MATQELVKIEDSKVPQFTIANITNYTLLLELHPTESPLMTSKT